jgi:hypothetical protein
MRFHKNLLAENVTVLTQKIVVLHAVLYAFFRKNMTASVISGQSSWLQIWRPGFDSRYYQKRSSGSGTGSTQPREYN